MDIIEQLKRDEGVRAKPYVDTVGKTTIGVGRNLTDVGLSDAEIDYLLANDISRVIAQLSTFSWFTTTDPVRQGVLINMAFNLGVAGLLHFPTMLHCIQAQNWIGAATAMLDSAWAGQVGARAHRLATQMQTGVWQ
jgi:lysozyme